MLFGALWEKETTELKKQKKEWILSKNKIKRLRFTGWKQSGEKGANLVILITQNYQHCPVQGDNIHLTMLHYCITLIFKYLNKVTAYFWLTQPTSAVWLTFVQLQRSIEWSPNPTNGPWHSYWLLVFVSMYNHPSSLKSPAALTLGESVSDGAFVCFLQCWKDTCGDSMSSVPMQRQSIDPRKGLLQSPHQMMYCKCLCVCL